MRLPNNMNSLPIKAFALLAASALAPAAVAEENRATDPLVEETAFVSEREPNEVERRTFATRKPRYHINSNDLMEVKFRFTPEFDQEVRVQPDGFIPVIDAGEIHVAGLTVEEIKASLRQAYAGKLREPVISVTLKEFAKPYFVVGGQVKTAGKYDLVGQVYLSEAIAMAGGFERGANKKEIMLFRRVSNKWTEVKKVDLRKTLKKGQIEEDILLRDRDSLYISGSKVGSFSRFLEVTQLGLILASTGIIR